MSISADQRWTTHRPCVVCGGHQRSVRGGSVRCSGWSSEDGEWAHCSREEHAGSLELKPGSDTYAHKANGPCKCGVTHGDRPALAVVPRDPAMHQSHDRGVIESRYDYIDPSSGKLLFQVLRFNPKGFSQRRPAIPEDHELRKENPKHPIRFEDGAYWVYSLGEIPKPLYRQSEVAASDPSRAVFVLEGEKDVDRAWRMGLVATCNVGGALKFSADNANALSGRTVYVIPDGDSKGKQHADDVVRKLRGHAKSARLVPLPFKDFSDWVDSGATLADLRAILNPPVVPPTPLQAYSLSSLLQKQFPPVIWAVPDLIPMGLTMIAGKGKSGKSLLMLQICLGIAHGGYVLGNRPVTQGTVLYIDLENGEELLKERVLEALHGQTCPDNFFYKADETSRLDEGLISQLEGWMIAHPDTRLIIIDTFETVRPIGSKGSANAYREDYGHLKPLADFAKNYRICVGIIHHVNKREADDVFDTISGTMGIVAAVDSMLVMGLREDHMILAAKGRRISKEEYAISMDPATAQWTEIGKADEVRRSSQRETLLDVLRDAGAPLSPKDIAERCTYAYNNVKQFLYQMRKSGDVIAHNGKYEINPLARDRARSANSANHANPTRVNDPFSTTNPATNHANPNSYSGYVDDQSTLFNMPNSSEPNDGRGLVENAPVSEKTSPVSGTVSGSLNRFLREGVSVVSDFPLAREGDGTAQTQTEVAQQFDELSTEYGPDQQCPF